MKVKSKIAVTLSIMILLSITFVSSGHAQLFYPPVNLNPFFLGLTPAPVFPPPFPFYSFPAFRTAAVLLPTATTAFGGVGATPGGTLLSLLPTLLPTTTVPAVTTPVLPVIPTVAPSVTVTLNIPSLTLSIPASALAGLIPAPAPVPVAPVVTTPALTGLTALMGGLSTTTLLALGVI